MAFNRANCVMCGKEFSPPFIGEVSNLCPECDAELLASQKQLEAEEQASRLPTTSGRATLSLLAINIIVYLAMVVSGVDWLDPSNNDLVKWGANFGPLSLTTEPWRMLTSIFVHIGLLHMLLNCWALFVVGLQAEAFYGTKRFLAMYLLSGLGGKVISLWWSPLIVSTGASGAVFGVFGATFATLFFGRLNVPKAVIQKELKSIALLIFYNLLFSLKPGINGAAHVGGLLMGFVIGAFLFPPREQDSFSAEVRSDFWRQYGVLVVAAALMVPAYSFVKEQASPELNVARADELLDQGKPEDALKLLEESIRLRPDLAQAYSMKANAHSFLEQYEPSLEMAHKASELDPENPYYALQVGYAYWQLKRLDEALAALDKAQRLRPDYGAVYTYQALVLWDKGERQNALQKAERGVQLSPQYAHGHAVLAMIYRQTGNAAGARAAVEKALELDPNDETAKYEKTALEDSEKQKGGPESAPESAN